MASTLLTSSSATTLVSNRASSSPLPNGSGPRSRLSQAPSLIKTPSSRSCLVVRAQQAGGGSPRRIEPISSEQIHKKVALLETSPYVRTPWNTSEDEHEIKMWFDMPGLAGENIEVEVIDDLLYIKGDGGVDAFGNKILSPFDSRVQLPHYSWKEEITAVFKNGVLYITVPKITKFEHKVIHVPVRSIS
ncbi:small heat shock protein, chloroplastic-like isoform X2 [Chenopodium quinoa]|uniref:small heat shock protein, chloroplastic-like isoform X2 n=1 Tax=Chenopodium quinoa TaxID=63459 RepID=UPI000B777774|nr:small heat shock protein, chloroplastic-like isoform X2 [Chenopodium quinoa]